MDENYSGIWWSPEKVDKKLHGTLTYLPSGEICLDTEEYEADISELRKRDLDRIDILFGRTIKGKLITLQNLIEKHSEINSFRNKKTSFYVDKAILGCHAKSPNEIKLKKILVRFNNLDEWVNINGFKKHGKKSSPFFIDYKLPKIKPMKITRDLSVRMTFEVNGPTFSRVQKEMSIKQATFFELIFKQPKTLSNALEMIKSIQDFLTLATQVPAYPITLRFYEEDDRTSIPKPVEVTYSFQRGLATKPIDIDKMLFNFHDIQPNFKDVISKWLDINARFKTSIQSYFSVQYNPQTYLEHQFLGYVGAIEDYHRIKFDGRYVSQTEWKSIYKVLLAAIPDAVDKEFKEALGKRLSYSNEYSLRKRLKHIISVLSDVAFVKKIGDKNFVSTSVVTRNFLTHHEKSLEKKSFRGKELYIASLKFKIIFECCILREISFEPKQIQKITENAYSRYKL